MSLTAELENHLVVMPGIIEFCRHVVVLFLGMYDCIVLSYVFSSLDQIPFFRYAHKWQSFGYCSKISI